MAISKDLFLAILSLDSYNRGYHSGISDTGIDDTDGLGEAGFSIGSAKVEDVDLPVGSQAAGFYAISYKIVDGDEITGLKTNDTIIAYRCTDDKPESVTHINC